MGLIRDILFGEWISKPEVTDNREDFLVNEHGRPVAMQFTGAVLSNGQTNEINHEDSMHGGMPHRDPVVRTSWNPFSWLFFPSGIEKRKYPINVSADGRVGDVEYLEDYARETNGIINASNGRTVKLVELSKSDIRTLEAQEDQVQLARGVKRKNLRRARRVYIDE